MNTLLDAANEREWANDKNWHWARTVYFAPADSRVIVPKRQDPSGSRTLNFARGESWFIVALLLAPVVLLLGATFALLR